MMSWKTLFLLGEDHPEPSAIAVQSLDGLVLGISAVVPAESSPTKYANNEDTTGAAHDEERDASLLMVADSHYGSAASHAAIQRFPPLVEPALTVTDVPAALFEALLTLSDDIAYVGRGKIYVKRDQPVEDKSSTTFAAVLRFGNTYYAVSVGDSYIGIVTPETVEVLIPSAYRPLYIGQERLRNLLDSVGENGLNWVVRQGYVLLQRLEVPPGSTLFLCTDGIALEIGNEKPSPAKYVQEALQNPNLEEGVRAILKRVHERAFRCNGRDNVAIAAMRVPPI